MCSKVYIERTPSLVHAFRLYTLSYIILFYSFLFPLFWLASVALLLTIQTLTFHLRIFFWYSFLFGILFFFFFFN